MININGIPKSSNQQKNINIEEFLTNYSFDFMAFVETNCFWPEVEEDDKWFTRVQQWSISKSKSVPAYLRHPTVRTINQPGGVISMAIESTTNSVIDSGNDTALGRWL